MLHKKIYIYIIIKTRGYNRVIIGIRRRLIQQSVVWSSLYTICGLSLLLVLSFAPRGFCPDTPVFPFSSKTNLFQIPIRPGIRQTNNHYMDVPPANRYLFIYLFIYIKLDINYKRTANEHAAQSRTYKKTFSAKFIQSRHIEFCKADRIT